ncbi:MAG: ribonuclease Z [Spirochaetaceae bacterium]|nr:MAG: ribonuclease Z [Spirochaetaceae bacterium]
MAFEVFVLGTGGMMPLPQRFLTSVLLRREGELFLFDCGEGTQISLKKLNLKWKKISAIFISHTHADHVTGLPGILMLSSQVEREEPLYIYGPPRIKEYIEASIDVLDMYINYEIIVEEIGGAGAVHTRPGYEVRSFPLRHSKPCVGYVVEEELRPGIFFPEKALAKGVARGPLWSQLQNGSPVQNDRGEQVLPADVMGPKRPGSKFSFVTDTQYLDSVAGNVKDSDLFICEGMFTEELAESALEKKHLTAKQAATMAQDAEVKSMGLIHYSPRYTSKELDILLREAKEIFPNSFLTRERQIIEIQNQD